MANKVLLKKSSTAAKVPLTSDLDYGELALNYADGKLYYKTSSNTIKSFTDDTSVVTLTGTQTLTNKTLTSPTITSPTLSGGTINNTVIGGTTAAAGSFTTINASSNITATGDVIGSYLRSTNSSGDEGGEILLAKPQTNSTLVGTGVTIDVYQNKIRFFEQGGSARGAYIDLTAAGAGASSSLLSGGTTVNSFSTIAVSGQTSVAADSSTDTLTLVAGDGITLTTDHTSDSITITGSGAYSGLKEISQTGISSSTTLYSASATTYRGAKYTIQITNGSAYAMYEFVVMHDGTNVYFPYNTNAYAGDTSGNFQSYFSGDYLDSLASLKIQVGNTFHALNWAVTGGNLVFSASCSSGTISVKGTALLIKA